MIQMMTLIDVKAALMAKYAKIKDFEAYIDSDRIKGGFHKMKFFDRLAGNGHMEYFFHETFGKLTAEINTFAKLFEYLDSRIQRQLIWQKNLDENFAMEYEKEIDYLFDYSLIDNSDEK